MSEEKTIMDALSINSDGMDILAYCVGLIIHKDTLEDTLKTIMCSNLDSKEVMLAAYFIGKIERSPDNEREALTQLYIDRKERIESMEKFNI